MKLIIVRHGETEENILGIVQGQSIHGKLSEKGIDQAKNVSKKLSKVKIGTIFTSDSGRALDTAQIIAKFHPESEFISTKELRERSFGEFEGKKIIDLDWDRKPKNSESLEEVYNRVNDFLEKIKKDYEKNVLLVVSHANLIRILIGIIQGKDITEIPNVQDIKNGEIYEFEI
jgi:broad specificity phosphatase PhoE